MTDIIIQGIYGRMGRALVEKIGAREDCRIVAGVDREAGRIGEIPVYAGFDTLPCKGVIIDFSSPAGAVAAAQYGAANGLPQILDTLFPDLAQVLDLPFDVQIDTPGFGQGHRLMGTVKEFRTDMALDAADELAQRRLGDV